MSKMSVKEWKDFLIDVYFDAKNTGNILNRDVIDDSGSTPFVTASGVNNGVAAYIDASKYDIIKGDCILIGGKTFTLTYQKDDFVSNDSHNIVLYCKNCGNELVYLFVITVLTYIIHSGFISGYQNRYGDNLKPPTNVYHRMTA